MPRLDISMPTPKEERLSPKRVLLDALDQSRAIDQEEYKEKLKDYQLSLLNLQRALAETKHSVIITIEGPDAAGKGGAIRRLVERLDPRHYRVYSIVKPTQEEYGHHYLWRFWNKLPGYGQMVIFDRSWYGRVLVERVEGFATPAEWKRGFKEINSFERQLRDHGVILAKFWVHISREEQLRRFEERKAIGYKEWKLTEEDWRNREKWGAYEEAVEEMLVKTSTRTAPWCLVEGNDKYWARAKVLARMVEILSKELGYQPADPLKGKE